jgi:hypothetical protein
LKCRLETDTNIFIPEISSVETCRYTKRTGKEPISLLPSVKSLSISLSLQSFSDFGKKKFSDISNKKQALKNRLHLTAMFSKAQIYAFLFNRYSLTNKD